MKSNLGVDIVQMLREDQKERRRKLREERQKHKEKGMFETLPD